MKRRQLVGSIGTVGVSLVAGCVGDSDETDAVSQNESGNGAVESVVENWFAAAMESDIETANSYAYDDERSDYRFDNDEELQQPPVEINSIDEVSLRETVIAITQHSPASDELDETVTEWDGLLSEFATEELDGDDWTIVRADFSVDGEQETQYILMIYDGQEWLMYRTLEPVIGRLTLRPH